ncbi:MAG: hypothetical protein RLW62_01230 [Gammaproteobacteria bacterium]
MTNLPLDVLAVYGAAIVWLALLVNDARRDAYRASLWFGLAFLLALNLRYLVDGAPDAIAFFVSIYDVFDHLGLGASQTAPALATCPDNNCSLWGARYTDHASWGVAFHDRFLNGPAVRSYLLYAHLTFNSIVFVLMHVQLARPGGAGGARGHGVLGRVSFVLLTLGTGCAVWLAAELGPVSAYGGALSKYGFWFMSACVYGCAVAGVIAIRGGDAARHRVWMFRFAGSMWGAFWLFRVMLVVTGPLFRAWETVSLLLSIWLSAPLGILIAEILRRRWDRRASGAPAPAGAVAWAGSRRDVAG